MRLGLINSAWVQAGRGTAFGVRKTKEIGFDCIDVFADPLDIDARERRLIRDECARAGLPIVSLPCVAAGLIDFNPSVQRFHVDRVRAYLDFAYDLEARNVLLVLGEYIWQQEVIPPPSSGRPASAIFKLSASTPKRSAWRSPSNWSRSSSRCSMTWPACRGSWTRSTARR